MNERIIYLDNAATSFPKPASVFNRMVEKYMEIGVSPGRGSYDLAVEAEEFVYSTRVKLAHFFGAPDPNRVIFTGNATDGLNIALQGILRRGDHVVSTRLEHNSVLRPLYHLKKKGIIEYDLVPFDGNGFVDPRDIASAIKDNTKLVVVTHASNVLGTIQPIREIGLYCRERGVPVIIDAAQSAGIVPIDMKSSHVSAVAVTGHKSLLGPTGIGALLLDQDIKIESTRFGGTGVDSKSPVHTETFPHRLEAGTLNLLGIIGLSESLDYIVQKGISSIHQREIELISRLHKELSGIKKVKLYSSGDFNHRVGLLTMNLKGMDPWDLADILDADFGICARVGLHCAPLAHETIGCFPGGSVRFSVGQFNTEADIDQTISAIARIAESAGHS